MLSVVFSLLAFGCGGGGNGGGDTEGTRVLGGVIQGASLNITGYVTTLAGTPAMADGTGAAANFNRPAHAVSDGTYLYIADSRNGLIRKLDIATGSVTTMAGKAGSLGTTDGIGTAARFGVPFGIAIHSGSLYVSDVNAIRKIVISTGEVSTLSTTVRSYLGSVSITAAGDSLFIADTANHRILRVVVATGVVTTLAGGSSSGSDDGIGTAARFSFPSAITATSNGASLFVADTLPARIRQIEVATATVTTMTTSTNVGATGMATDDTYLYVTRGTQVLQVNIATGVVTALAGRDGTPGSIDGDFSLARFYYPFGITPVAGSLYITEAHNHIVRKLDLTARTVSTVAGTPTSSDGTGAAARFSDILGMTTDGTHLYVAEWVNHTVRKIVIATGAVTTIGPIRVRHELVCCLFTIHNLPASKSRGLT